MAASWAKHQRSRRHTVKEDQLVSAGALPDEPFTPLPPNLEPSTEEDSDMSEEES